MFTAFNCHQKSKILKYVMGYLILIDNASYIFYTQISGDAVVVRKALRQVSSRLHDNPSKSQHLLASSLTQPYAGSSHLGSSSSAPVVGITPVIPAYGGYKGDVAGDWPSVYQPRRDESSAKEFSLRLLCAAANVGGVIGKGGGIIKQIRQESGAFIKVDSSNSGAEDDCIITVSAKEVISLSYRYAFITPPHPPCFLISRFFPCSSLKILSRQPLMLQSACSLDAVRKVMQNQLNHHTQHGCWYLHHVLGA
jgi:hypothetical protein